MKYFSTRGGDKGVCFKDVLFLGYAKDGGMFLPDSFPQISRDKLRQWVNLPYHELAYQVVSCFLTEEDIPSEHLKDILKKAYSSFDVSEVVPVRRLANGLAIVEMYHGRSLSFKDLSMNCLGLLMDYFLSKEGRRITLVCCTSGDTGSSAIQAVQGLSNVDLIIILPRGRITAIQERQMTTVLDDNVHVFRIDGSSDDGDVIVHGLFASPEFVAAHCLGSASSLNFCRIMFQMVHIFHSYLKMCPDADREVELILPTGGGGNVTAGSIARRMGLPVNFTCAVNHNNALSRFMKTGRCDIGEVECTIAPAIDIQFPYNLERVWYMCSGDDTQEIKKMMDDVYNHHKVEISEKILKNLRNSLKTYLVSGDEEVESAMKRCWEENGFVICPHTGCGVAAYYATVDKLEDQDQDTTLSAVLATASPLKFPEAVQSAGVPVCTSDELERMKTAPTKYVDLEKGQDWVAAVKERVQVISARAALKAK